MKKQRWIGGLLALALLLGTFPAAAMDDGLELPPETAPTITEEIPQEGPPGDASHEGGTSDTADSTSPAEDGPASPTAITVEYAGDQTAPNGALIGKTGDTFQFRAVDQDGNETPVTWKNGSAWAGSLDENGLFTAGSLTSGGSSNLYITATSTLDAEVKQEGRFSLTGYQFSTYQKAPTVALSEDGQTPKTISASGGYDGSTVWTYEGAEGIARLSAGQDLSKKSGSIKFDALRPGTFTAGFVLDFNEAMTDTATLTITGVAVEDPDGVQGKTYLTVTAAASAPTVQLTAYAAEGRTVSSWSSGSEAVATVDENGLVTACGIGTALITATDSEGARGGIKVVVQSGETPYFENLAFTVSSWGDGIKTAVDFSPMTLVYDGLEISKYSTTKLILTKDTLYDTSRYTATAAYTDADGETRSVPVASGAATNLEGIPFDAFDVTITLASKTAPEEKTVYIFHVTRPRDTTTTLRAAVLRPDGRALAATKYNGYAEGTMFQLNEDGSIVEKWGSPATGVSTTHHLYKCYALDGLERFSLALTGSTGYTHLRWSADGGETWTELPQGGGNTAVLTFPEQSGESAPAVTVTVNILDDQTYAANVKAGEDGFAEGESKTYTITVEQASASAAAAQILTAETGAGDWYPAFAPGIYSYTLVLPFGSELPVLRYTAAEGASVKLGSTVQTPDAGGSYTLALSSSSQTLTVTSADGGIVNSYTFQAKTRTEGGPDRVTDFLCINSQYTNGGFGSNPQNSLCGGVVSLGNFGGYITYYYADGLRDDPAHRFGVDFYIHGNANKDTSTSTKTSFYEPGQVWVSEDGETWYALAGSAHYDEGVDWDYTVTYTRASNGKTAWTDSQDHSNDGKSYTGPWPSESVYALNSQAGGETITLSGIALPARSGDMAVSGQAVDAYPVQWGYADVRVNGTDDPYLDNADHNVSSSGFDLAWAVDGDGLPVDVSSKEFHYVKIQAASNIWHPGFGEKSPEIAGVARAVAQGAPVGRTALPTGATVTDGASSRTVRFVPGQQVYSLDVGDMRYVSVSVDGGAEDDNIYINNSRVASGEALSGIRVTKEAGGRLVRILVQNGDKEPAICLLRLTGSASSGSDLVEGIKVNAGGSVRKAETADGKVYTVAVGYRISTVDIVPVAAPGVALTIDGEPLKGSYPLAEGENTFTITGTSGGVTHTVTLKIAKESAPAVTGKITVWFSLLGDECHGELEETGHTLRDGNLQTWIASTSYQVDTPATALDILEAALKGRYDYNNADGNYISSINGLAEFDNGPRSGWMYTVNGRYPEKGIAEQTVNSGDRIVFHYTDDYTVERASDNWPSGSTGGGTSTEKAPEVAVTVTENKDGSVTVAVSEKALKDAIAGVKSSGKDTITIAPEVKKGTDTITVELPKTAVSDVVKQTKAAVEVKTDIATVTLPNAALADLSKKAGSQVGVAIEARKDGGVKIDLTVGGKSAEKADGGIAVSVPAAEAGAGSVLVLVDAGGKETIIKKSVLEDKAVTGLVEGSCTVKVADHTKHFTDTNSHWAKDAIAFASSHGLFGGVGGGCFAPDAVMDRAMVATVLYRLEDAQAAGTASFTDVPAGTWYSEAVAWASEKGIVKGTGTGFDPSGSVTREQLAAMLYRYAQTVRMDTSVKGSLDKFSDGGKTSVWAKEAMTWAVSSGLIGGKGSGTLDPAGGATRAEVAAILERLVKRMVK